MLKFAVNTGMLFAERPFFDRFEACRSAGFQYVEFPFPYSFDPHSLGGEIGKAGLTPVLFDLPVDDWESGGRGCATDPEAVIDFREGLERAVLYASILKPQFLTCIVGKRLPAVPLDVQKSVLIENLQYASDKLAPMGVTLLVETLNDRDHPGFFLTRFADALSLKDKVNRPNFKIQMDTYHVRLMGEDPEVLLRRHFKDIGHIQIGDVPGRHQPGTGGIDFPAFFQQLEKLGYSGFVGLEYIPLGSSLEALAWVKNRNSVLKAL